MELPEKGERVPLEVLFSLARSYEQKQRAKLEKELDEFLFSPED